MGRAFAFMDQSIFDCWHLIWPTHVLLGLTVEFRPLTIAIQSNSLCALKALVYIIFPFSLFSQYYVHSYKFVGGWVSLNTKFNTQHPSLHQSTISSVNFTSSLLVHPTSYCSPACLYGRQFESLSFLWHFSS